MADPRTGRALALMVASGFAGLGYQIVWTRQGALWLGQEAAAVLAVVAAFFAGLALGAGVLGRRIERSARPARAYAACEAVIGAWGLVLAFAFAPASGALLAVIGGQPTPVWQWAVAFGGTFVLLLPATAAMGATLPAMERVLAATGARGSSIALLYAGNTAGAVLGVLAAAFWLVPALGLARTAALCAACNLVCAGVAWTMDRPTPPVAAAPREAGARRWAVLLAATGLLGIGYEVLVVRVLSQVAENTVYTFAMLLAVYLVGTALGAAWWQRRPARPEGHDALLAALAGAGLLGVVALYAAQAVKTGWLDAFGPGLGAALSAEAVLALLAFGAPTFVMGALFGHLAVQAQRAGLGFAAALAANTAGAAVAPLIFGVLLLPALGAKLALLIVAAGYLLLTTRHRPNSAAGWSVAAAGTAAALLAPPLVFIDVPPGGRVLSYREGATAAVSVVEDADGVARLRIDNRAQEGSSATRLADARQALLPLLLHQAPRRALFLGLGTGVTAASAALDPTLAVDVVELVPEVVEASAHFVQAFDDGAAAPRLHVVVADARRHVRTTPTRYDLIVADNIHPARSGTGALYTTEHFQAVRERLDDDGLFCQWLPLHQLDLATLRSIVASFLAAYPDARALLATNSLDTPVLGLVGRRTPSRFDPARLRERLAHTALPRPPSAFGLADEHALLGSFVAGPAALAAFAGDAKPNTDDRPVVAYQAPRVTYAPAEAPRDRLLALLQAVSIDPREVLEAGASPAAAERLAAYWRARDRFLAAGRNVRPTGDVHAMLAQVREPLLAVLRISPDFRPAREPLLRMARELEHNEPAAAGALREQIAAADR